MKTITRRMFAYILSLTLFPIKFLKSQTTKPTKIEDKGGFEIVKPLINYKDKKNQEIMYNQIHSNKSLGNIRREVLKKVEVIYTTGPSKEIDINENINETNCVITIYKD